jgi:hypothetical protein
MRRTKPSDVCRACGKLGHWAMECRSKGRKKAQAHVAEEEEVGLLIVESSEIELLPCPQISKEVFGVTPCHFVHLVEHGVLAQIGEEREAVNSTHWVVDTGVTNHMAGARDAFSILDTGVCGTVRFGEGSVVRIKGCGTIIFGCKNGEHLSFSGIYFIPKLKANMLDVGQLDEIGYEILMVNVYQGC